MVRILKTVVVLVVLALAGLAGYAYFGDMSAPPQEVRSPVDVNAGY
ncbi:MAG: hypothetical protein CVT82_11925 [Alphaproteobacteria bacterium HGW-Alphaproteobacteria-4]|jgi:predicted negative regulator of RcsB-dependent stress response|nr:MAG: hypothetical protein CVT82_11925 [Alphaproteobacteria bacterium HGW-Alphaproteobacteria-4]